MSDVPLPEPDGSAEANKVPHPGGGYEYDEVPAWSEPLVRAHAAAVSAADNAALRAELAKHQESEFHPDWSMLEATRDSLSEHQQIIRDQQERIRVLEDALENITDITAYGTIHKIALAALGDKT